MNYVYFRSDGQDYRFPIGTNMMNGKIMHDMVMKYELFSIKPCSNLWLDDSEGNSHFITDATILVFQEDDSVVLVLDRWIPTMVDDVVVPTLAVKHVQGPVFNFS